MPKAVTTTLRDRVMRTSSPEAPLVLLTITHPLLATPVRVVNDTQDIVSRSNNYVAIPFRVTWPDDQDRQMPRARLAVDNVGRELMAWLEASAGGTGATATLEQILPSTPDVVEISCVLDILSVTANVSEVSAELGFENIYAKPLVRLQYRPESHPGMF